MLSGPVVAMVVEGQRCIEGFRSLAGATDPTVAAPGTIRGDLGRDWGHSVQQNIVHGSDSPESAEREIAIWFSAPGVSRRTREARDVGHVPAARIERASWLEQATRLRNEARERVETR